MPSKVIPQEHKDAMVSSYLSGKTAKEAAAVFGYSHQACYGELERRGIGRRGRSEAHRKYEVDQTFFDVVDSEEKAYWLGFLTADGTIEADSIRVCLAAKDRLHLVKFLSAIQSEHPIGDRITTLDGKEFPGVEVHVGSQKLSGGIQALGVTPRKSFSATPSSNVPEHLLPHYWRGVIDGDGSFVAGVNKRSGRSKWSVQACGTKAITQGFVDWVCSFATTGAEPKPRGGNGTFVVKINGNRLSKRIAEELYRDAHVWLDRKHEIAKALLATGIQRQDRSDLTLGDLELLYIECGTWASVAKKLGTSASCIHRIRRKLTEAET